MPRRRQFGGGRTLTPNRAQAREKRQLKQDRYDRPATRRRIILGPTRGAAFRILFEDNNVHPALEPHFCGDFTKICTFCRACRWVGERANLVISNPSSFRHQSKLLKMSLELRKLSKVYDRHGIESGDKGFLILAKVKAFRTVNKEGSRKLKAVADLYYKEKNAEEAADANTSGATPVKKENGVEGKESSSGASCPIAFHPCEVYDNCSFFLTNLEDPSDFAHYFFTQIADHPEWPQPRFPLRVMPVEVVCRLQQKAIEAAVKPILEKTFGGDESIRFSFILHTRKPSPEMTLHQAEAIIRNCLWSINPNCVQCLKYQDFAIMIEIIDSLLLVGTAKSFNQLGRYNTSSVVKGRDLKEGTEDSEDDISDDPYLTEEGNVKRKLEIKRKRRMERAEEAQLAKQAKTSNEDGSNNAEMKTAKEELNGGDE